MKRDFFDEDHELFRSGFRSFLQSALPKHELWEKAGEVDREFWRQAGALGYIGFEASPEFGGLAIADFRYNVVIAEEMAETETPGDGFIMNDIIGPYLMAHASPEQQRRWLPGFVAGELIAAIAMSEPDAGSDLARIRSSAELDGDSIILNGSKTFITNGARADLVIVLARTGERDGRGMSLIAVEVDTPGFVRGRTLAKIGRKAQDTAELFFNDARVPRENIIGPPGQALSVVMRSLARERLALAVSGMACTQHAFDLTLTYCRERSAFGRPLVRHQSIMHNLAEMRMAVDVAQSHLDRCVLALNAAELTAEEAAGAKYWATELQWDVTDRCLQLFGGYGYMDEYPISRLWRDARVQRIYGGTSEIMKEIVGRSLAR
jgi:acyl-CoA dehydrogenase